MTGLMKRLLFCGARSFPADYCLPDEGHVWVCVGTDDQPRRFELEANFLNHPLFEELLRLSVEHFGYSYDGALRIACEADLFLHLLRLLRSSNPAVHYMDLRDLVDRFYAGAGTGAGRTDGCRSSQETLAADGRLRA